MINLESNKLNKKLIVYADIDMYAIIPLVKAFIKEIQSGDSGAHEGSRNGIVFTLNDNTVFYVYQTDTSIIIRQ